MALDCLKFVAESFERISGVNMLYQKKGSVKLVVVMEHTWRLSKKYLKQNNILSSSNAENGKQFGEVGFILLFCRLGFRHIKKNCKYTATLLFYLATLNQIFSNCKPIILLI